MKANKLAFVLFIMASLLCFTAFGFRYFRTGGLNYPILFKGIFVLGFGISMYYYQRLASSSKQGNKPNP